MMSGQIQRSSSVVIGANVTSSVNNSLSISPTTALQSPLQIFVRAKKRINDIYGEVELYVGDSCKFLLGLPKDSDLITKEELTVVDSHGEKVKGIREVLSRDHMKVAFFGRTSNGKSTVINSMLRERILPSGIGHTTNCFIQVEGSENGESYLISEDSADRKNVKSVSQLAHSLCTGSLGDSSLVRVYWPTDKCPLLRDDVVLVDSPGIDVSPNLDSWIDRHCLDADVFVLVANSESTLMLTEKNFFFKVSARLSKPNVFVLNNRWDASASEPEFLEEVRRQHLLRTVDFLVDELKVCATRTEAEQRVFFVSAKEVLQARINEFKGLPINTGVVADGFHGRYFEFQDFERKFEECISKSAVRTKFNQHTKRGKAIVGDTRNVMEVLLERASTKRAAKSQSRREVLDHLDFTEKQLQLVTVEMKDKICKMVEEVEHKVSKALNDEIRRLSVLVDEFHAPFHSESLVLQVYKKELHNHVEACLGSNLRARLSTALALNMEQSQKEMIERVTSMLPAEKKQLGLGMIPRREPFEVLYRLNCDNLCADFTEDIEFRFSFGITAMVQRFTGKGKIAPWVINNYTESIPRPMGSHIGQPGQFIPQTNEDWSLLSRLAIASVTSQGTMGGLLVAGFLMKTVGWRLIFASGVIYGGLYLYERLTWTNKAKERAFKRQYVDHATRKLRLIVDLTSANCSHQVQQELSSTFARLCHLVDGTMNDMQGEIKQLESELRTLDEVATATKVLRNKANYLVGELDRFDKAFLTPDN
uniref:EOG090X01A3 n=1 Tax=Simocephalus serrulatus TaxID=117539 RepID=A0A4Y7NLE1_9CRUS|nr:EOG090X01A3 [Simocephalus serrulatus]SVE94079.1 EOG090X01A3 [Simocephalus serrulatus]